MCAHCYWGFIAPGPHTDLEKCMFTDLGIHRNLCLFLLLSLSLSLCLICAVIDVCKPLLQTDSSDFSPTPQDPFHADSFLFSLTTRNLALIYNIFFSFSSLIYIHKVVSELLLLTQIVWITNLLTGEQYLCTVLSVFGITISSQKTVVQISLDHFCSPHPFQCNCVINL